METNIRRRQRQNVGAAFGLSLLLVLGAYFLLGFAPFGDCLLYTSISPMRWYEVLGQTAKRDFAEDEKIEL